MSCSACRTWASLRPALRSPFSVLAACARAPGLRSYAVATTGRLNLHYDVAGMVRRAEEMKRSMRQRGMGDADLVDALTGHHDRTKALTTAVQELQRARKAHAKNRGGAEEGAAMREELTRLEQELEKEKEKTLGVASRLPNWVHESVPVGQYDAARTVQWIHGSAPPPKRDGLTMHVGLA